MLTVCIWEKEKETAQKMGMSASQVRFLSLQNRKHSITNQLAKLSNRKMALSRDMNSVAMKYTNALNQKLLKWSNDSGSNYNTLTYNLLMHPNEVNCEKPYIVTKATTGQVVLNNDKLTDIHGNQLNISYVDIAKMISTYSGISDSDNKTMLFNGQNAIVTDADGKITAFNLSNNTNLQTDNAGRVISGDPSKNNAYNINKAEPNYEGSLRCQILHTLGVYSDEDYAKLQRIFMKLYGGQKPYETGVYPVGSAMGDLYIARAQLDAYQQFLNKDHPLSLGNTYGGLSTGTYNRNGMQKSSDSKNAVVNDEYSIDDYHYSAVVDGRNGKSTVTQNAIIANNGNLEHVDFTRHISTDSSGNTSIVDGTISDWSSYTIKNKTSGETREVGMSSNGVVGKYTEDSILKEALANYKAKYGLSDNPGDYTLDEDNLVHGAQGNSKLYIYALSHAKETQSSNGVTYNKSVVAIYKNKDRHKRYTEIQNAGEIKVALNAMCDGFADLMGCAETARFNDAEAHKKAKTATVNYLYGHVFNGGSPSGSGGGWVEARSNSLASAYGYAALGVSKSGRDYCAVSVDTAVAYDLYMTYYNYYAANPSQDVNDNFTPALIEKSSSYDSMSESDYNSLVQQESAVIGTTDKKFKITEYGTTSSDGAAMATTIMYDLSATQTGSYTDDIWINETTGAYSDDDPNDIAYTHYYVNPEAAFFTYYTNAANSSAVSSTAKQCGDGSNIYGYYQKDGVQYKYTDRSALVNILNGTTSNYQTGGVLVPTNNASTNTFTIDAIDPYKIIINPNFKDSYYDSQVYAKYDDDGMFEKLQKNVQDKQDIVDDLLNQIDDIGASKFRDYYDALFDRIGKNGWVIDDNTSENKSTSTTYVNNKLQNNDFFITVCEAKIDERGYNYTSKMAQSVTKIYEVYDDNACNTALAEYESDKKEIQEKENRIDLVMEKLETEQEAINTTMDSVKKIINNNIKKTFKMFA